ncbi:MAG: Tm-1-like ATP-binding domain-containing protein [Betaproteobacteria bacterium]|nr:Tm-1-like ATP-binding domain-containing protein [Betaproteobacteria bacterium]
MTTVVLAGTLDTKGIEYAYVRDRLREHGVDVILIDVGILGEPLVTPDIGREVVAAAGGADLSELVAARDRGRAIEAMAVGLGAVVRELHKDGELDALLGLGGGGGSALLAAAMRELPIMVPKLLVSTMVGGETRSFASVTGITVMHAIVDIAGLNRISERVFTQAAAAAAAMAQARATARPAGADRPLLGATMFGVTTPCVTVARERLESLGYEVLVFHATGTGGKTLEQLVRDGTITGVLDTTTTELADDLVGGVPSAGPDRLEAAGELGIPQVVSLGALDMVNFGPVGTVPAKFKGRLLYKHNSNVTLMRTTPEECAELGKRLAQKLNQARGPVTLFLPLRGISSIATAGQVFHDPDADAALIGAIRETISGHVVVREIDTDINDPAVATAMADALHDYLHARTTERR